MVEEGVDEVVLVCPFVVTTSVLSGDGTRFTVNVDMYQGNNSINYRVEEKGRLYKLVHEN